MKAFWIVLACGVGLLAFSMGWSFLAEAASQRSDFGVVAGALAIIVIVAAAAAFVSQRLKRKDRQP